ncbi:50S ribosomal protein L4 [Candidatus Marsarchaeota archaeon]|jgi:large subunit ribosomal protein L4e|nr:50S ribosomal protein L4 [Candidatus Marsarchaeota archaeon]MCL5092348.1 50S ribosomal protein L4 [Candidatus Marsarchaeota archaeon]
MAQADVLSLEGKADHQIELPYVFDKEAKDWLIRRAVIAESSQNLQPQGHYLLAGMQTTAAYYGAMMSYRTGRHMGKAIRPREKLGGGVQGKVKRIPSAVKGKRAHPHVIEKRLNEYMGKSEYLHAMESAIAATSRLNSKDKKMPLVMINEIESIKKTKEMVKVLKSLSLDGLIGNAAAGKNRKGIRRSSKQRISKQSVLLILNEDKGAIEAARNIRGVKACTIKEISANKLAPGGSPIKVAIWSEDAVKNIASVISKAEMKKAAKTIKV